MSKAIEKHIKEARRQIEKMKAEFDRGGLWAALAQLDFALAELARQPEAGGFTKRCREEYPCKCTMDDKCGEDFVKALDVIDRQAGERNIWKATESDLMAQVKSKDALYKQSLRKIKQLQAENEQLHQLTDALVKQIEGCRKCFGKYKEFYRTMPSANLPDAGKEW